MNALDLSALSIHDIQRLLDSAQNEHERRLIERKEEARRAVLKIMEQHGLTLEDVLETTPKTNELVIRVTQIPTQAVYVPAKVSRPRGRKPKRPEKPKVVEPWKGKGNRPDWAMGVKLKSKES